MAAENFKVKKGLEVGTAITATSSGVNVTGVVTATQFVGDGSGLTGVTGSGSGVVIKHDGSAIGTASTINFSTNLDVSAISAGIVTITASNSGLSNVVEDTTPQLGGNLDLDGKFINGTGGANITGVVTATTGDFVNLDVDGETDLDDVVIAGITTFSVGPVAANGQFYRGIINSGSQQKIVGGYISGSDTLRLGESMYLSSTGLGIGSASPTQKLDVNGSVKATGADINGNADISGNLDVDGQTDLDDVVVAGVSTFNDGITLGTNSTTFAAKFADDAVANFGTDNDLQISHDNSNALIRNSTGKIVVVGVVSATSGANITGVVTATTFSGSGASLTNLPSGQLSGALPALDGSALTGVTASGSGIVVKHDGTTVGTAGTVNFSTNLDVSAISAGIVTVTASGGSVSLSGSTNNTVATVTGANALIGEANLTFDGSTLDIAAGSDDMKMQLSGSAPYIQFREGTTNKAYIQWSTSGYLQFGNEEAGEVLRLADGESGLIWRVGTSNRTVWTSGNDGASSGLNADLLDGEEGSYYTNASNLGVGTIPSGRFPATLPAASGANLTSLTAGNISGTIASGQIADEAVTFAKMQHVGTGVFIGRDSSGTGDIETMTAAEARTLLNVADGATAGITTTDSNIQVTWTVTASGQNYRFTGPGNDGTENHPDLYLVRGQRYRFIHNATSSHPLQIQTTGGSVYTDGVKYSATDNGGQTTQGNNLDFNVQHDAPAQLTYNCTAHGGMEGNIYIVGQHLANGADNRIVTATSAYGLNGEAGLTYNGSSQFKMAGSGQQDFIIGSTNAGGTYLILDGDSNGDAVGSDYAYIAHDTGGDLIIGADNPSGDAIISFKAGNNDEKVRISSDGRVSIGVNPSIIQSLLNVKTDSNDGTQPVVLRLGNDSSGSGTGAAMVMGAGSGASSQGVTLAGFYDGTGTSFTVGTNNAFNSSTTTKFVINNLGNVKIGSGTPGAKFHVEDANTTAYNANATTSAASIYLVNTGTNGPMGMILQNASTDGSNTCQATIHSIAEGTNKNTSLTFGTRQNSDASIRERLRITSTGDVGIGTDNPTASNITTSLSTNTKSLAVGIVTCNELYVSGIKVTSGGHYADLTAAAADGMSHYFPGSSSTSLISNLSATSTGNPVANQTADSYFNNYPYYDFYTGNANENGYIYTQTTAKWADGPFSIAFWVKPMASTLESESTFVQLGDHPSGTLRCLYTTSTDGSRQIKTITIGDDASALNTAVLTTDWNHWVTTYDGSVTRYYLNGSLARSHTHSGTLDVGTGNKYIYVGYGYWNSTAANKASMSHMSDIGIWNAKELSAATISSIYNAKRTVVGY